MARWTKLLKRTTLIPMDGWVNHNNFTKPHVTYWSTCPQVSLKRLQNSSSVIGSPSLACCFTNSCSQRSTSVLDWRKRESILQVILPFRRQYTHNRNNKMQIHVQPSKTSLGARYSKQSKTKSSTTSMTPYHTLMRSLRVQSQLMLASFLVIIRKPGNKLWLAMRFLFPLTLPQY